MSNEELNRKISEARKEWNRRFSGKIEPKDWTGSEEASAVLLEEMPFPVVEKRLDIEATTAQWHCMVDPRADADGPPHAVTFGVNQDRKTAIALAWLKWKGITA